jgi:hypothetical protein
VCASTPTNYLEVVKLYICARAPPPPPPHHLPMSIPVRPPGMRNHDDDDDNNSREETGTSRRKNGIGKACDVGRFIVRVSDFCSLDLWLRFNEKECAKHD